MGLFHNHAKAVRIYNDPISNSVFDVKADVLMFDGVIEHYNWSDKRQRKTVMELIDSRTYILDERKNLTWEDICKE